jgi:hypothetical protein
MFHSIVRAAAQRFIGVGQEASAGYALIYRGFYHSRMKAVCVALDAPTLNDKLSLVWAKTWSVERCEISPAPSQVSKAHVISPTITPILSFFLPTFASLIDSAEYAMDAFERTTPEEQSDVLALLMVGARV